MRLESYSPRVTLVLLLLGILGFQGRLLFAEGGSIEMAEKKQRTRATPDEIAESFAATIANGTDGLMAQLRDQS